MIDSAAFRDSYYFECFGIFYWCLKQEVWVVCADTGLMLRVCLCGSRCWETVHHTHSFHLLLLLICSLHFLWYFLFIYEYTFQNTWHSLHSFTSSLAHTCKHTGFARFVPLNWARLLGSPSSEVTDRDWRTFMFVSLWQRNRKWAVKVWS